MVLSTGVQSRQFNEIVKYSGRISVPRFELPQATQSLYSSGVKRVSGKRRQVISMEAEKRKRQEGLQSRFASTEAPKPLPSNAEDLRGRSPSACQLSGPWFGFFHSEIILFPHNIVRDRSKEFVSFHSMSTLFWPVNVWDSGKKLFFFFSMKVVSGLFKSYDGKGQKICFPQRLRKRMILYAGGKIPGISVLSLS